jgi:Zn-finger nucleic acid-binding protein
MEKSNENYSDQNKLIQKIIECSNIIHNSTRRDSATYIVIEESFLHLFCEGCQILTSERKLQTDSDGIAINCCPNCQKRGKWILDLELPNYIETIRENKIDKILNNETGTKG